MNYIKRLELELKEANADKEMADYVVNELFRYLNSDKFACGNELDGYISIRDVRGYLTRIRAQL